VRNVVHRLMGQGLAAGSQGESGDELRAGVAGDPQPGRLGCAVQLHAQLIELYMRQLEGTQEPIV
jgi:hypothetical protein